MQRMTPDDRHKAQGDVVREFEFAEQHIANRAISKYRLLVEQ